MVRIIDEERKEQGTPDPHDSRIDVNSGSNEMTGNTKGVVGASHLSGKQYLGGPYKDKTHMVDKRQPWD